MGKSTLINLLVKDAAQATREISRALSTGRHTTSFCRMFTIDAWGNAPAMGPQAQESLIIDSPGFQLFGLAHLSSSQLMHALPDVARWLGQCRFSNCSHRDEPGCLVSEAVRRGEVDAMRLRFYRDMLAETEQPVR
jgi:ribosome biogenesis GTPase